MKKKIRKISTIFLCLLMVAAIFAVVSMNIGAEEEPEIPEDPVIEGENEWWVEGYGTYFELTNSPYLNITLTSSENVYIHLESIAEMVSYYIEVDVTTISTEITISGFEPSKIYYRYQDGNLEDEFTTDESGSYTFTQDISTLHHVFIRETHATIYIRSNGDVDPVTAPIQRIGDTYRLTGNIYDTIIIQKPGITFDGNGKTMDGRYDGIGIYISGCSGITIKSVRLLYFHYPIYLFNSNVNTIQDNELLSNQNQLIENAIRLTHSNDNIIEYNTISFYPEGTIVEGQGCRYGIFGPSSSDRNTIRGNSISDCYMFGIMVYGDHTIMGNTVENAMIGIIAGGGLTVISENTVVNTGIGIRTSGNSITANTVEYSGTGIYLQGAGATVTVIGNTVGNCNTGIKTKNSGGAVISDNHFSNCGTAIDIDPCTSLTISGNIIMYCTYGIYLEYSDGNTLSGNTIMYTTYALYFDNSNNNIIFRNNLIGNMYQVYEIDSTNIWDNGAGEGSYWSDYQGEDLDGDGIGDTLLPHNGVDYFPLVNQWFPTPLGAVEVMKEYIRNANLPHETEKGLIAQLNAVENALSNGHEKAAVKILNGFIKHVEGLRNAGILTEEQCEYLTLSAQELIRMIGE